MSENVSPPPPEVPQHADPGDPDSGFSVPRETLGTPPFLTVPWQAPSRLAKLLSSTVTITLRVGPTMLLMWMIAPPELKYELRKQARWLPYAAKYAAWWLRQEGW
jgi:hypothetical protein